MKRCGDALRNAHKRFFSHHLVGIGDLIGNSIGDLVGNLQRE
jgi:hypothetical protein